MDKIPDECSECGDYLTTCRCCDQLVSVADGRRECAASETGRHILRRYA